MKTILNDGKIISIANTNDIFMTCEMVYLTTEKNLNNVIYTEAFVDYVVEHKEDYICIPLVVDLKKLLERDFDNLTHLLKDNKFGTTSIGSFFNFYKFVNEDNVVELRATIRIPKRNEEICGLLSELHASEDGLRFSYEISVLSYTVDDNGTMIVDEGGGKPIGSCVVSIPAVPAAKCKTLVAELIGLEGEKVDRIVNFTDKANVFVAELTRHQIEIKMRRAFENLDRKNGFNLYIEDVFKDFIVALNCNTGDYVKFAYTVEGEDFVFADDGVIVERSYVETMIAEATGTKVEDKDTVIAEKDQTITKLNKDLVNIGEKLAEANEVIKTLSAAKAELDAIVEEREKAERAEKVAKLEAKCKKVMSETEVAEYRYMIDSLDESGINAILAEKYVATAEVKTSVATSPRMLDSMIVAEKKNKYITL